MSSIKSEQSTVFALIDCNHFYVSCERAFRPDLENRPVGILSNNDGCIVALSPELKKLGIERGVPYFKIKHLINKHKVVVFSSNYSLYGDMSFRVMSYLEQFSPEVEVYSIDEAFLSLQGIGISDYFTYGTEIRQILKKNTGIPVSVGIAPTKTLAKIANRTAKREQKQNGVYVLFDEGETESLLKNTLITDVWGIGYRYAKKLGKIGINTAWQLTEMDDKWIQRNMTIVGLRTVRELRGVSSLDLETVEQPKKNIVSSRSFGKPVESLVELKEAAASYCLTAVEKLRKQKSLAKRILIYLTTNHFRNEPQYANYREVKLSNYSAYPPDFIKISSEILSAIYKEGYRYKKVGVMLNDIIPQDEAPYDLFEPSYPDDRRAKIMECVDSLNQKYGSETVSFAGAGIKKGWQMRRELLSPRYTTNWKELLKVKA